MANDRLFITCKCGESFMLAKMSGMGVFYNQSDDVQPRLEKWLTKHGQECFAHYADMAGAPGFALGCESLTPEVLAALVEAQS